MKKLLTLIILLTISFTNAQELIYSNKNARVVKVDSNTYELTYGKTNEYTSVFIVENKQQIDNIVLGIDRLLASKKPGLSSELVTEVEGYTIVRNKWNIYAVKTMQNLSSNNSKVAVRKQKLQQVVNPLYIRSYYSRPYIRYYSRF